jgi:long-chain acyl-CoA synthetase
VAGISDAYRVERARAVDSLKPGLAADPAEIVAYRSAQLTAYKCSREVPIIDILPKIASGRILRRELRDQ